MEGIINQGDQNWQIEPDKSVPFSEKETDPIKRKNEIRRLEILRKLFLLVLVEGSEWLRSAFSSGKLDSRRNRSGRGTTEPEQLLFIPQICHLTPSTSHLTHHTSNITPLTCVNCSGSQL